MGGNSSSVTVPSDAHSREMIPLSLNLRAAIEAGPQPNGVVRADIYNMVKEAWELTLEWIQLFNSGRKKLALTCNSPAAPLKTPSLGTEDNTLVCTLLHSNRKHVRRRGSGRVQDSDTC